MYKPDPIEPKKMIRISFLDFIGLLSGGLCVLIVLGLMAWALIQSLWG